MDERFDILVIGSGIAGLTAALEAAELVRVLVLAKASLLDTSTWRAQGGIAAVFGPDDTFSSHIEDTLKAGAGLCNEDIVRCCVSEAPERIDWLRSLGVAFDTADSNPQDLDLGREGGHSKRRIVHAKDMTGRRLEEVLLEQVERHPNIELRDNCLAVDLVTMADDAGTRRCAGCYVMDIESGKISTIGAGATILATGGAGKVYLYTSNPDVATGDGLAMGWRAGASIMNMEFFQFHPTCLFHAGAKNFLISEAVRGEGGVLVRADGHRFMPDYAEAAELAPRDVVARAIDAELKRTGDDCVYLDISHRDADFLRNRFPLIHSTCLPLGIDLTREPIPVVPAAHYQCGGIQVDMNGWSGVPGLYAAGEVACTGMHGANRLASNSLLEALVFARKAAHDAIKWSQVLPSISSQLPAWTTGLARDPDEAVVISQNWDEVRRVMWNYVGVVRSDNRLERARKRLSMLRDEILADYWRFVPTPDLVELRNLADVAHLILEMAIGRKESRGLHFNLDYPEKDDPLWGRDSVIPSPVRRR